MQNRVLHINSCCDNCATGAGSCKSTTPINGVVEDILTGGTDKPLARIEISIEPASAFMLIGGAIFTGYILKRL